MQTYSLARSAAVAAWAQHEHESDKKSCQALSPKAAMNSVALSKPWFSGASVRFCLNLEQIGTKNLEHLAA